MVPQTKAQRKSKNANAHKALCASKGTVVDKLNQVKKLKVGYGPRLLLKILAVMKEQAELDEDEGFEEAIEFEILSEDDESDQEPDIDSEAFGIKWTNASEARKDVGLWT